MIRFSQVGSLSRVLRGVVGPLSTNCYIFRLLSHSLVVDPGDSGSEISRSLPPTNTDLFLTHGHVDHISGVADLCKHLTSPRIFASLEDFALFEDAGLPVLSDIFRFVKAGRFLDFGKDRFRVLGLPGHTPGSLGLYSPSDKCVFVGDTLFYGAVGTVDSDGGFWNMVRSIRESLFTLPDDTVVLPGHGPETTIGREKLNNPFLIGDS